MLKPDPDDMNIVLLLQISSQLANSSLSPAVRPPEKTTTSAVRINIFWFSSLVFCLTTALVGILVKQWLRDYLNNVTASPQESARIRQFRYQSLVKWRVPEIISILPLLIQFALAFFFVGLLDLLWGLDYTVAGVISVLVVLTLTFLVITTIIPAIYEDSPYRSPQAFAVYLVRMRLSKLGGYFLVWSFRILGWTQPNWPLNINVNMFRRTRRSFIVWARDAVNARSPRTWVERERLHLERHGKHFDHQIIADADSILMDPTFLKQVVRPCLKDTLEPAAALSCLLVILKNRSHTVSATGELMWKRYPSVDDGFSTLMDLVVDFLGKHATINQGATLELLSVLGKLCKAMPFESGDPAAAALFRRVYSILAKFLSHESEVQRVAFNLMREMFTRSDGPMDSDGKLIMRLIVTAFDTFSLVAEKILMYGRQAHLTKDDHTFHASCYMVLSIAHRDLSTDMSYGGLRGQLEAMLVDLELHLNEIRTSLYAHRPIPSPPLLVALLDMADIDRNLVPLPPIQLLSSIILGSSRDADSEGLCAVRRAEDLISLRSAYSGSTPRRRCAVRPVDSLGDLGLRLTPASGSQTTEDDRVVAP